jgi:hypothetical protein
MKLAILFFIGLIVFSYYGVWEHETVHQIIYDDYGINSTRSISGLGSGLTTTDYNITEDDCPENCQLAHEMNEAITYNSQSSYFMMGIGLFMVIALLEEIWRKE